LGRGKEIGERNQEGKGGERAIGREGEGKIGRETRGRGDKKKAIKRDN